jgi:hypothetical protein
MNIAPGHDAAQADFSSTFLSESERLLEEVVFFVPRNKLFRLVCPCVILPESTRIYEENTTSSECVV